MIKPFKDFLFTTLSQVHDNVIPGTKRPKGNKFPSVTYSLPTSNTVDMREDFILEINIWDKDTDAERADIITDNIETALKTPCHNDENQLLMFKKLNRLEVPDQEEDIQHRQLRYLIKRYER